MQHRVWEQKKESTAPRLVMGSSRHTQDSCSLRFLSIPASRTGEAGACPGAAATWQRDSPGLPCQEKRSPRLQGANALSSDFLLRLPEPSSPPACVVINPVDS
ncbi:Golgin Subfamily A Member 8C [Manis pentadactyla]|nr:Golgin Subfamily A Member 8C [Manis pentadactyla]